MRVHVKCSTGDKVTLDVAPSITVAEFKAQLEQSLGIPVDQQRLIYAGRVMKDQTTLESNSIKEDHTIHLVRGASNNTATQAYTQPPTTAAPTPPTGTGATPTQPTMPFPFAPGGMPNIAQLVGNENFMRDMMNNPLVQSMLSNPELMRNLLMSQPQMREIVERNPEVGHILNNPETLRQAMEMMRNPELMREMMRHTDRAMVNLENIPEGFNMLRRMYETVQEPLLNSAAQANPFASLFTPAPPSSASPTSSTGASPPPTAPNTTPLPNPWAGPTAPTSPTTPPTDPSLGAMPMGLGMDPGIMMGLLQNPAVQTMMQQVFSNPELLQQMMGSNPLVQQLMATNPAMRNLFGNPELLRQLTNPQNLQALLQIQTAMQQLQRSGLLPDMPLMMPPAFGPPLGTAAPTAPAGAPFDPSLLASLLTGGGAAPPMATPAPAMPPEERFRVQLQQLAEMGFTNVQDNIAALQATGGSVQLAIERLLANPR